MEYFVWSNRVQNIDDHKWSSTCVTSNERNKQIRPASAQASTVKAVRTGPRVGTKTIRSSGFVTNLHDKAVWDDPTAIGIVSSLKEKEKGRRKRGELERGAALFPGTSQMALHGKRTATGIGRRPKRWVILQIRLSTLRLSQIKLPHRPRVLDDESWFMGSIRPQPLNFWVNTVVLDTNAGANSRTAEKTCFHQTCNRFLHRNDLSWLRRFFFVSNYHYHSWLVPPLQLIWPQTCSVSRACPTEINFFWGRFVFFHFLCSPDCVAVWYQPHFDIFF